MTVPHDHRAAGGASDRSPVDPTGDDPALERRLRAADPLAGVPPDDSSTVLVRRLAADVAGDGTPSRRRPRRTALALLAAALLVCLAAGSPGVAQRLAAWTGIHGLRVR